MPPCLKDAIDVSCGWRLLRTKLTCRKQSVESAGLGLEFGVWGSQAFLENWGGIIPASEDALRELWAAQTPEPKCRPVKNHAVFKALRV